MSPPLATCVDRQGNLIFGGRLKDMLKIGGENVAAVEIEDYLLRHPAVRMAQVVGVRDARYGEVVAAFIELNKGHDLDEKAVTAFCLGAIASYKVPRYVRFVSDWPMSGTKVKKFELKDRLTRELDKAGIEQTPQPASTGHTRK